MNSLCEDFIADYQGETFDMIYVDPARRDMTKKVFLIEDCSPDIVKLLPSLSRIGKRLVIKLSPLFDRAEAERIFGSSVTLRAVSVAGECKELIVEVDLSGKSDFFIATDSVSRDGVVRSCVFNSEELKLSTYAGLGVLSDYRFISIADVALRKMRCCDAYYAKYHSQSPFYAEEGVALWFDKPDDFNGRLYSIEAVMPYKPKEFKRLKIKRATVVVQNFPVATSVIKRNLSITDGNEKILVFTRIGNNQYIFICV